MRLPGRTRLPQLAHEHISRFRNPDIAFAHTFHKPPYGGANQFLLALRGELRRRGFTVEANAVTRNTRACLLNAFVFDERRLAKMLHAGCRVVHRVDGPVALYRGFDDGADRRIVELNQELANATVFQSQYSLDAHGRLGIELRNPVIIPNAVDPTIFFAPSKREPAAGRKLRIVATSWSPNPNKGSHVLRRLEDLLDRDRFELTFVGQLPEQLPQTRVVPPLDSRGLAELLRTQDIYLAPSLNDPCSNALLEALACGLPAVYARSGGHPELVGEAGLGFDDADEIPGLLDRIAADLDHYRESIRVLSLEAVADRYLAILGLGDD